MKKQLKSVISLFAICAVIAIALAFINTLTSPIIKKNEDMKANEALFEILPDGEAFEKADTSKYTLPSTVKTVYSAKNGGYVFELETTGYSAGMIIMCGINPDGTVSGAVCLSSGETLGYEKTFGDTLRGKDSAGVDAVDTVNGATKTTEAYKSAVKDAIDAFNTIKILSGGNGQ